MSPGLRRTSPCTTARIPLPFTGFRNEQAERNEDWISNYQRMEYVDTTFPDTFIGPTTLRRSFIVLAWNGAVRERIMSYWRTRDFAFSDTEGEILAASR